MRRAEILFAIGLLIFIGVIIYEANRLGFGYEKWGPAPGFTILWLAIILLLSTGGVLVGSWLMKERKGFFLSIPAAWSVARVALTSAVFCILIWLVGLYIAMPLFCFVFSAWLGRHRWYSVLAFSILTPIIVYFGFEKALMVPLPKSPLYGPGLLPF